MGHAHAARSSCTSQCHATFHPCLPKTCFGQPQAVSRPQRGARLKQNALPDTTSLAVTQQGAVFAVTVVAEGLYTRTQMTSSAPGRPSLLPIVATSLGLIAALGLMRLGDQGEQLGLVVGGVTSAIMLLISIKRSLDTEGDSNEWPGPKAWPVFISTGAFFAMLAFFQALQYI